MASRGGPRAMGSDGSDFTHREQVATRYQASTLLKSKLKVCAYINMAVCLPQAAYILNSHLDLVYMPPEIGPNNCHYLLLLSSVFSLLYIASLPRNKKLLVQLGNLGTTACGLGGVVYGYYTYFPYIRHIVMEGEFKQLKQVLSFLSVVWYVIFTIKLMLYVQTLYYARQLMATWDAKKTK